MDYKEILRQRKNINEKIRRESKSNQFDEYVRSYTASSSVQQLYSSVIEKYKKSANPFPKIMSYTKYKKQFTELGFEDYATKENYAKDVEDFISAYEQSGRTSIKGELQYWKETQIARIVGIENGARIFGQDGYNEGYLDEVQIEERIRQLEKYSYKQLGDILTKVKREIGEREVGRYSPKFGETLDKVLAEYNISGE